MPITRCFVISLIILINSAAYAGPTEDFEALLDDAWEWQLVQNPVFASSLGDRRFNDQWTDNSIEAIERRQDERQAFLDRVIAIDSSQLDVEDQLNYDLFRRSLQTEIDGQQFKEYLMPMSQRGGVQSLESTAERLRMQSTKDYEDWLARMAKVETVIEQTMKRMGRGRKDGYMPPKILMERIPDQLAQQTVENPEDSPFYGVFESMPD